MRKSLLIVLMAMALILATGAQPTGSTGEGSAVLPQDGQHMFVGADKCKGCHLSPKKGAQYKSWAESKHAKAYETLASPAAKEIAAKKGIANPQEDGQCLKCHIDGYGVDAKLLGEKYNKAQGVGCESCHGAGGDYWTKEVMADVTAKKITPASVGLTLPDEKVCRKCHNEESPSYKEFNFDEMFKKITHPMPKG